MCLQEGVIIEHIGIFPLSNEIHLFSIPFVVEILAHSWRPEIRWCVSFPSKSLLQLTGVEHVGQLFRIAVAFQYDLKLGLWIDKSFCCFVEKSLSPADINIEASE